MHRRLRGDGQLELPGGVLRVELLDHDALVGERGQQVAAVVGGVDQPGQAVRRAGPARGRSASPSPSEITHSISNARPDRETPLGQVVDDPAEQQPAVDWSCGVPSCAKRSPGAQAQPGWAARTTSRSRSGTIRWSPTGPAPVGGAATQSSKRK